MTTNSPAQQITDVALEAGAGHGICPVCAGIHRLTARGAMVRHGFSAKNVRHGQNGGFHIGGHSGCAPVGTEAGNRKALAEAQGHIDAANRLALLPVVSRDEASLAARQDMLAIERKRVAGSWGQNREAAMALALPTEDEARAESRWMPSRAWINEDQLAHRAASMQRAREGRIDGHRAHAALLAALVALNPAGEG